LKVTAEHSSHWSLDPLYRQRTHYRDLQDLTRDILNVTDPQTSIKHRLRLVKREHILRLNFFDQRRYSLFFYQVNSHQMVLGFDSVIF